MARREWTKQEEMYMQRRYLLQPVEKAAEKLNRSLISVRKKASKMGLSHYIGELLSAKILAKCFNSDVSVVIRWINQFDLPCKKIIYDNQTRYLIDISEFWKWAEKHRDIICWSKYEMLSLCPEPEWAKEEIKKYSIPKSRKKFTQQEIITIKNLLHLGLRYKKIATKMGRSYNSINHLCRKIYE